MLFLDNFSAENAAQPTQERALPIYRFVTPHHPSTGCFPAVGSKPLSVHDPQLRARLVLGHRRRINIGVRRAFSSR